ncbi:MAG TPA: hypothetical protein VMX13_08890 [Sedimentisphaerales bacterium]|nr:hypothetical protein [Sedimentisphaerales bacterium]
MNTTKITLSLAAVLCVLLLWPNEASAGCSVNLSIGGYIGSDCASRPHHADHDGRCITYIGIDRHRRLLGNPPMRPCSWVYIDGRLSHRPARQVVTVYEEPAGRVTRHGYGSYVQRNLVYGLEIRHR